MNRKSFLWALIGLFAIIGVAGVISCQVVGPPPILNYYEYMIRGDALYDGDVLDKRLTMDEVEDRVRQYLRDLNDPNLEVKEIIEFTARFYVIFSEKDTEINAFVGMIDPYTGRMYSGHHPDRWWNTKYVGSSYKVARGATTPLDWPSGPMTITEEQAWNMAQSSIDELEGEGVAQAGVVETFYGYYTIPILLQGDLVYLVTINGYTGGICYEACHGRVIDRVEFK